MKKQELIKHIEDLPYKEGLIVDKIDISRKGLLELVKQLDEPEKVKIPSVVADWYEENKDDFDYQVWRCVFYDGRGEETEISKWICITEDAFLTLVNMHQFGYEVEKEKRYKVVMPNIASTGGVLTRIKHDDSWIWIDTIGTIVEGRAHTRKELEEAGFGWVFDCSGIKIEEVTE